MNNVFLDLINKQVNHDAWTTTLEDCWIRVSYIRQVIPNQGWKLHVCASVDQAVLVLERSLPVLLASKAKFKVAATLEFLRELNLGLIGSAQRGKFITVYPFSDEAAVTIARELDVALTGLHAFRVPSDRKISKGSLVSYRYGAFFSHEMQLPSGEIVNAILDSSGQEIPDERKDRFSPPHWAVDPFANAGLPVERLSPRFSFAARFLPVDILKRDYRSSVYAGVDIHTKIPCVLKHAHSDCAISLQEDPCIRLRHEAGILRELGNVGGTPNVICLVQEDGDEILALEYIDGRPLDRIILEHSVCGTFISDRALLALARDLIKVVLRFHRIGIVHGDLSAANVLVSDEAKFKCIIDFESAVREDYHPELARSPLGTRGYVRQADTSSPPVDKDDYYSLGAILFFLVTGADPHDAPNPVNLLARQPHILNTNANKEILALMSLCLSDAPADRIRSRLSSWCAGESILLNAVSSEDLRPLTHSYPEVKPLQSCLDLVNRMVDVHFSQGSNEAPYWINGSSARDPRISRDLEEGVSGVILSLTYIRSNFPNSEIDRVLADLAHWLTTSKPYKGGPLPGLYVGEAGVALALARAGQELKDDFIFSRARDIATTIASLGCSSPDVFHGSAGKVRFHLAASHIFDDPVHLRAAGHLGEELLESAIWIAGDQCYWSLPKEGHHGSRNGRALLGYAHGAAGIADVLLDIHSFFPDPRFLETATAAARWICGCALLSLTDGRGLDWTDMPFGRRMGPMWCHGAGGISRFLARITGIRQIENVQSILDGALETICYGGRWSGPGQCHGLAGQGEVALDLYRLSGNKQYLESAKTLAKVLEQHLTEDSSLPYPFATTAMSWSLLNGLSGISAFLGRLANPENRAHILSLEGLGIPVTNSESSGRVSAHSVKAGSDCLRVPLLNQAAAGYRLPLFPTSSLQYLLDDSETARLLEAAMDQTPLTILEGAKQLLSTLSEDELYDNPNFHDTKKYHPKRVLVLARVFGRRVRGILFDSGSATGELQALLDGKPVACTSVNALFGADLTQNMIKHGLIYRVRGGVRLPCPIMVVNSLLAVVPSARIAYLGLDSLALLDIAMRLVPNGDCVAELACGTGFAALMLASRFNSVMAADISEICTFAIHLNICLNYPVLSRKYDIRTTDVTTGIPRDSCDLVLANAPWVPTNKAPGVLFADGGPTGAELPIRFIREGAELLRPGGILAMLVSDATLKDGRRPIQAVANELHSEGFAVFMFPVLSSDDAKLGDGGLVLMRAIRDISVCAFIAWRPPDHNSASYQMKLIAAISTQAYRFSNGLTTALPLDLA